ncbi:IclR family transcriptional regulator [Hoeflea sp. TYP-13]|uniref:IclR family transcriptional regulator n=1 Tax=Hoeflea sp. TYP-13 TaxID=3230023 RepID=UPI0034C5CBEE
MVANDSMNEADGKYRAPALEKGLDIIELLAGHADGRTQAEIAKALGRSVNEIYRMLTVLVQRGYVSKTPDGDRFQLSMKLFTLSHRHPPLRRLVDQATPLLREAVEVANQSAHIGIHDRGEIVVAAMAQSPENWGLSMRVGAVIGLYNTGTGRILAAFASSDKRAGIIREHELVAGETQMDSNEFDDILDRIVARGYEDMPSETTVGVTNLSFPIFGPDNEAVAALTCPYLQRIDVSDSPDISGVTEIFADVARRLSMSHGARE